MNNNNKKATINDVAKMAGVSKKTVSRVINNEDGVSKTTLSRVKQVVEQLNYSPNPQARGLASNRSFLLAMIYDNPNHSYITEVMYGVLDQCRSAGYELVIHPCNLQSSTLEKDILTFVEHMKIDGLVLIPPLSESESLVNELKKAGHNYVRLLSVPNDDSAHMVHSKDCEVLDDIAEHLIALGHSDIGFIQGPENSLSAKERFDGFRESLKKRKVTLPANRIAKGKYTFQSGLDCCEWLLNSPKPPTAIFASNDEMAMGAMVAAEKMGFKIPADLTIVGFDDSPHASQVWPSLTTVNLQARKMGQLATDKLLLLCSDDKEAAEQVQHEVIPQFILRQSTAVAPNG